jgi:hypothetical protein
MIGASFLLGAALFAVGLVRRILAGSLNQAEQALWGLVIGWTLAAGLGYVFARLAGGLNMRTILLLNLFVWLGTILCWLPALMALLRGKENRGGIVWEKSFATRSAALRFRTDLPLAFHDSHASGRIKWWPLLGRRKLLLRHGLSRRCDELLRLWR